MVHDQQVVDTLTVPTNKIKTQISTPPSSATRTTRHTLPIGRTSDGQHANNLFVVTDNLNTHTITSLYLAFLPDKAYALAAGWRLSTRPTKHDSRLHIAEIKLSSLTKQCLGRCIVGIRRSRWRW